MNWGTIKSVTIPQGKAVAITQGSKVLWQAQPGEHPIINLIDAAGVTANKRISTSGGGEKDNTGTFVTGYIQLTGEGDVYRTSGANFNTDSNGNTGVFIYQEDKTYWTYTYTKLSASPISVTPFTVAVDANGNLVITTKSATVRWIRLCGIGTGEGLIVTKNQVIE